MAWYRSGTVAVTNGSQTVTGTGTDFVANVLAGDSWQGPDGKAYEVQSVTSSTVLVLVSGYLGATAAGQGYAIQPTQSYVRDLALSAATLLNTFGAVRDGIGAGLIADGTVGAPGIRFSADQDTGLRRTGANGLALVTAGADRISVDSNNYVGIGTSAPAVTLHVSRAVFSAFYLDAVNSSTSTLKILCGDGYATVGTKTSAPLVLTTNDTERARLDAAGSLLVGTTTGSTHTIAKAGSEGTMSLVVSGCTAYYNASGTGASASAAAQTIQKNSSTNRSINAAGTINASGADYAEYMTKAAGCGTIAPGDVCGVDADGRLTRTWADALNFVVKSTDPAYVGGDRWAAHLPPRPEQGADETDAAFTALHAAWEADLEAERQKVDRIAFSGQVPVNVTGDFVPGDYLIAAANGAGIKAVAVAAGDIDFNQYRRRLGKVWAARDGRAWVDVQHG